MARNVGATGEPPKKREIFPIRPLRMGCWANYSTKTSCTMAISATPFKKSAVLLLPVFIGNFLTKIRNQTVHD
jgi:hypothetical protein